MKVPYVTVTLTVRRARTCAACGHVWVASREASGQSSPGYYSNDEHERRAISNANTKGEKYLRDHEVQCPQCSGFSVDAMAAHFSRGVARGLLGKYVLGYWGGLFAAIFGVVISWICAAAVAALFTKGSAGTIAIGVVVGIVGLLLLAMAGYGIWTFVRGLYRHRGVKRRLVSAAEADLLRLVSSVYERERSLSDGPHWCKPLIEFAARIAPAERPAPGTHRRRGARAWWAAVASLFLVAVLAGWVYRQNGGVLDEALRQHDEGRCDAALLVLERFWLPRIDTRPDDIRRACTFERDILASSAGRTASGEDCASRVLAWPDILLTRVETRVERLYSACGESLWRAPCEPSNCADGDSPDARVALMLYLDFLDRFPADSPSTRQIAALLLPAAGRVFAEREVDFAADAAQRAATRLGVERADAARLLADQGFFEQAVALLQGQGQAAAYTAVLEHFAASSGPQALYAMRDGLWEVCSGDPASSPVLAVRKVGSMLLTTPGMDLPQDLTASTPAEFQFAVCLRKRIRYLNLCGQVTRTEEGPSPLGMNLVRRQVYYTDPHYRLRHEWTIEVREVPSAKLTARKTFIGASPLACARPKTEIEVVERLDGTDVRIGEPVRATPIYKDEQNFGGKEVVGAEPSPSAIETWLRSGRRRWSRRR